MSYGTPRNICIDDKYKACFNMSAKQSHFPYLPYSADAIPETARCTEKCLLKGVLRNSFFISLRGLNLILYHIWVICLYKRKDDGHENTEKSNIKQIYNIIFVIFDVMALTPLVLLCGIYLILYFALSS